MKMINIEYIFSAGFRCYSPDTLKKFKLRPFSGPFDYLFIDIETVFTLINQKMSSFLENVIIYNNKKKQKYHINAINELNEKNVCYMGHNYNEIDLQINTNFLDDKLPGNIYEWKRICIFLHSDIHNQKQYEIIKKRVDRFNKIIESNSEKTCLFYITKIITMDDIYEYMNSIISLKKLYFINTYIIVICCCDNLENSHYFKENILFIIKKVPHYNIQIREDAKTDNNFDYTNEINIMKLFFNFQLIHIDEI